MLERDWKGFDEGMEGVLKGVGAFVQESNADFKAFFEARGQALKDLEPEVNFSRVIGYSLRGDLQRAIVVAKEIQKRFPEWSQRTGVDGTISQLEEGRSPFML